MVHDVLQRLRDLPPRSRVLLACAGVAVLALVLLLVLRSDPSDLAVQDSGAGNAQATAPQDAPAATPDQVPGAATPDGTTVGEPGSGATSGVAPISSSSASDGSTSTPADQAIEDELNARLPKAADPAATPTEIAATAPADVKFEGRVLELWSSTLQACLRTGRSSGLDCLNAADAAAPGVQYQDGQLAGDLATEVTYQVFRRTAEGVKVWLLYNDGHACHGYGDNFDACSAW